MPISGKPEIGGADPESRYTVSEIFWIPGSLAEFIIGPRFARTRWLAPRNDNNCYAATMLGVAR
jgi:hypothetical protein